MKRQGFTLLELLMVAVVMTMIMGVAYSFYINMTRVYARGSNKLVRILEAASWLEVISRELRSAVRIVDLEPDVLTYQRYYEETEKGKPDPVRDLNAIRTQTVSIRARETDDGSVVMERKVGMGFYEQLDPAFRAKGLSLDIFKGFEATPNGFEPFRSFDGDPEKVPLVEIRLDFELDDSRDVYFRRVFLPAVYGSLPHAQRP